MRHATTPFGLLNSKYDVEGAVKWVLEHGTPDERLIVRLALFEYATDVHIPDPEPHLRVVRWRLQKKLRDRFQT